MFPLRMMDYSPPNSYAIRNKCSGVLRETCKSVQSFSNNSVTIQIDQNSCAGILDEENVSSVIAIYHEQWLLFLCYLSYISRFKMYAFRSPLITDAFAVALFRHASFLLLFFVSVLFCNYFSPRFLYC